MTLFCKPLKCLLKFQNGQKNRDIFNKAIGQGLPTCVSFISPRVFVVILLPDQNKKAAGKRCESLKPTTKEVLDVAVSRG